MVITYEYDKSMKTRERIKEMPFISFPINWLVRIIPPFGGACIRFHVREKDANKDDVVSIYLDMDDNLGSCGEPYWEVYPYNGDTFRCGKDEIDELLKAIQQSLDVLKTYP